MHVRDLLTIAAAATGIALPAIATPFDGLYAPSAGFEIWSCEAEDLGGDGGAVGIVDGFLQGVENACELGSGCIDFRCVG